MLLLRQPRAPWRDLTPPRSFPMSSYRFLFPLALAALPLAAPAQTQPGIRTLASFTERFTTDPHVSPDGRFVLLPLRTELRVYNVATRKSTKIADGPVSGLEWSRRMDRIAWVRRGDDGKGLYIWTMPVDPSTGAAKGPAQRVTAGQGNHPAISVDGKWIAYQTPEAPNGDADTWQQPYRLVVAPVTGGPERTIAHLPSSLESEFWSADGKSIYTFGNPTGAPKSLVSKVYLDGRAPETIRPDAREWLTGMTTDRRFLVTVPARNPVSAGDRAVVIDTTGREVGLAPLPVGTVAEYDHPIDSALVWVGIADNRRLEIRALDGSAPRRIATPMPAESPIWSPDGKRIAFQVREDGHNRLALMNPDGSGVEVLHTTDVRPDQWGARWSPDSKSIAYESADWRSLMLLDVASRKVRPIATDTTSRFGLWIWRADGQSITSTMPQSSPPRGRVDEIRLDGSRRTLLDLTPTIPTNTGFQFIDANNAVQREDSAVFIASLGAGTRKRVASGVPGTRTTFSAISHDGRTFAGLMYDPKHPEFNQIEILTLDNGQRRILELPFQFAGQSQPKFTPDNRTVLVVGRGSGDTTSAAIYAVPINGDPPRELAVIGGAAGAAVSVSPDGKSVVYSVQDVRTTSLLLVDLRAVMKAAAVQTGSARKP